MTPDEARKFFAEHQTRYLLAQFVDIHGAAKAKAEIGRASCRERV